MGRTWPHCKSTGEEQPDKSPVYADANDTNTQFYFTLERHPVGNGADETGNTIEDEEAYVIPIPDNIYDKTDDDMSTGQTNAEGLSQFYFTLEQCAEEGENEDDFGCENSPSEGSTESVEVRERQGGVSIDIEDDQVSDEDAYVISMPIEENEKTVSEANGGEINTTDIGNDMAEKSFAVNIPEDANDSVPEVKDREYTRRTKIEDRKEHGKRMQEDSKGREDKVNSKLEAEKFEQDIEGDGSEEIYQNVKNLYSSGKENESHKILLEECPENVRNTTENFDHGQVNLGLLDDEVSTQSDSELNKRQNKTDKSSYVIQIETKASDSSNYTSENIAGDDERYSDDEIYENWEDNIIGRGKSAVDESEVHLDESGDDIYENNTSDIVGEGQSYGRENFYQNVRDFRPSLVM